MISARKELFNAIKSALKSIPGLEMVDLQRNQMRNPKKNYPTLFTTALIRINQVTWQAMTEQKHEGKCSVEIAIYVRDGWLDHHDTTTDDYNELDLIDDVMDKLQGVKGYSFRPLNLTSESEGDDFEELMEYKLNFDTTLYRIVNSKYTNKKITLTPR